MGVGIVLVTNIKNKRIIEDHVANHGVHCYEIGKIISGNGEVVFKNKLNWDKIN